MKIVVQTGNSVGRIELEYFIKIIPSSWLKHIDTIVVYGSRESDLEITYHEKQKLIGIHTPSSYKGSVDDVLNEVAISLSAIEDFGHIPDKISVSRREEYKSLWDDMKSNNK